MINSTRNIFAMVWSSHPVCIRCRLPRFCTFSILSILNLMWSWPFLYALLQNCLDLFPTNVLNSSHIYCILCHPINFHFHITVHISLSLSQFLANSLHPSHSTCNTPSIWEQEAEVEGHFFLQFLGCSHIGLDIESQQIWLWPSQKRPLLEVCTFPKRIWGGLLLRATLRRFSCS